MTMFPVPATVVIGLIVGLIIIVHMLSQISSCPSGLRGWPLAHPGDGWDGGGVRVWLWRSYPDR